MNTALKRFIFFGSLLVLWEVIFQLNIWPKTMFPGPVGVANALVIGFTEGTLIFATLNSLKRLFIGLLFAVILGTLIGVLLAKYKTADETLGSLVTALQTIPSIVWLPLALTWFKFSEGAIIFVVILGGMWPMIMNMRMGFKNVEPILIKAAKTMGSSGFDLFRRVMIPASIPYAITGLRLSWAFSWRALMAGELIGPGPGLGYTLMFSRDLGNMNLVVALMVVIAVIGSIIDNLVFQPTEKKVLTRWGLEKAA
ncbi:ABC transporter permease [Ammoniphilus oxalaticus]|uniref:ABC transporter permease n=1 Tax=Ammoniphilus oxalaticus TaxID=66863 RepID=A0A419SJC0_9BACL|nr:ABC transporter permease [Ammoniphilus oxalaticus]RKD24131.1 ABC transporter permease [Ammoniphilus oxalaticus]